MKASGKRHKGARLERLTAEMIESILGITASRMPYSGAMEHFKGDINAPEFPFTIECKNQEKLQIWNWWEQTVSQAKNKTPMMVFTSNHKPVLVALEFEHFLKLYKELDDSKINKKQKRNRA